MIRQTEGRPRLTNSIRQSIEGSVFDESLENQVVEVGLPPNILLTLPTETTPNWLLFMDPFRAREKYCDTIKQLTVTKGDSMFIALGPLYKNRVTNELYTDPLRRAVDRYFVTVEAGNNVHGVFPGAYQSRIMTIWQKQVAALEGKGGYVTKASTAIEPYSGRGVIIPDPTLPIDGVRLPLIMLARLVRNSHFAALYGIGYGDTYEKLGRLHNQLVLIGRQPTHLRSNILALRLRTDKHVRENYVVALHPSIVHLFSGDFDGDNCWSIWPNTEEGKADLPLFTIEETAATVGFSPGKELSGITWTPKESMISVSMKVADRIGSTNGSSINYYDVMRYEGEDGTGFYNAASPRSKKVLTAFARGVSEDEAWHQHNVGMCSHRAIKDFTAKGGGLAASIIQLAYAVYEPNEVPGILSSLGRFKHSIVQASLDSKNKAFDPSSYDKVYDMFHDQDTIDEAKPGHMYKVLRKVRIDKGAARAATELMFTKLPRRTIRELQQEYTPLFYLTRRLRYHNGAEVLIPSNEMLAPFVHADRSASTGSTIVL